MEVDLAQERVNEANPLDLLGTGLRKTLETTVADRSGVEQRWIEDLQQYLGQYDEKTLKELAKGKRSSVFLNITRVAVNQSESQLADLLFPTDDKNYGIAPTPNPAISADLKDEAPATTPEGGQLLDAATGQPVTKSELAARARQIARDRAEAMERELDDQLVECDYPGEARKALHYAAIFGTGILAGPEATTAINHRFKFEDNEAGGRVAILNTESKRKPIARCVQPWDFYPDMSGATIQDAEFIFERTYMTRKQLRALAKRKGYKKENISKLLGTDPKESQISASANYINQLRTLTQTGAVKDDTRYEVWMYHGPINKSALIEAGVKLDPEDPLDEFDGVVVFSNGIVIKAALNPLESEHWPYSVWCWQKDDFSIFGYGVPWLCRNEQRIVNTAWRMMLDNSAKSAGPQVIAKRSAIAPADGDYTMSPWKLWYADETISDVRTAFTTFNFQSNQQEIANILTLAKQFSSETAGLPPLIGQGQGQAPNTLGGMAMLMNSSNTDRRRQVRDWDDNVTKPLITRFYHWNMQYNPDESIKGDYEVHARGTSALLLREQQAINLMALLDKYSAHPVVGPALKSDATLRKIVQALHISPEEVVKTKEELELEAKAAAEQPPQEDPQIVIERMRSEQIDARAAHAQELQAQRDQFDGEQRQLDRNQRRDIALLEVQKLDRQLQMQALQLAQTGNQSLQKILADLKKNRWKLNLDSQQFDREMQLIEKKGATANYGLDDSA